MRVVLIGQAAFAEKALEVLHARGDQIVHVFGPPEAPGGRPDPLKAKALELGLPFSGPKSFKGEAIYEQVKALDADLCVMAFVTLIVPERVLFAPRHKTICFHPSLLPRHRGASAINWTLMHGDTHAGITWFWPDRGLDTGPILLQRRVPIGPNDSTGSLYFNTLFPLGIETLSEAMRLVETGTAPRIEQNEASASYEAICRDEHAKIDLTRPVHEVHNLIRGCDPQPGAFIALPQGQLRLYDSIIDEKPAAGAPGTVSALSGDGLKIALDGGSVLVRRVRLEPSAKKVAPVELGGDVLRVGARLN